RFAGQNHSREYIDDAVQECYRGHHRNSIIDHTNISSNEDIMDGDKSHLSFSLTSSFINMICNRRYQVQCSGHSLFDRVNTLIDLREFLISSDRNDMRAQ